MDGGRGSQSSTWALWLLEEIQNGARGAGGRQGIRLSSAKVQSNLGNAPHFWAPSLKRKRNMKKQGVWLQASRGKEIRRSKREDRAGRVCGPGLQCMAFTSSLPLRTVTCSIPQGGRNATWLCVRKGRGHVGRQSSLCPKAIARRGVCGYLPPPQGREARTVNGFQTAPVRMAETRALFYQEQSKPSSPDVGRALWGVRCLLSVPELIPGTTQDHRGKL